MFRTLLPLLLASALVGSASLSAKPKEVNGIAAIVNGRVITKSEVAEQTNASREMIMMTIPPGSTRNKELAAVGENALNGLIERELILAEFTEKGFAVKPELLDEDINKIIQGERFGGDRDKFLAELKRSGMTLKRFKDLRRKIISVEMMRSFNGGGVKIVTPQQLQAAYDKHGDRFRGESFVRLRTLMIPKATAEDGVTAADQRALAINVRRKILAGDDFAQMAKTYSKDSVADIGGDRGTIGANSKDLRPDLVAAAMRLSSGQVSELIEYDPYAFWILKAENKKLGAKKPLSDPQVRAACERLAMNDIRSAENERWVAKLKRSASIRRFDGKKMTNVAPPRKATPSPTPSPAPAVAAADPSPVDPPAKKKLLDRLGRSKRVAPQRSPARPTNRLSPG